VIGMVAMLARTDATLPVATRSCCKNAPGMSARPPECDFDTPRRQAFPPADDNTDNPLVKAKGWLSLTPLSRLGPKQKST
jgi:hypothetical protein